MTRSGRPPRHLDHDAAGSPLASLPGLDRGPAGWRVRLIVGPAAASCPRGQVLAWAAVNMLARCTDVISELDVHCAAAAVLAWLPDLSPPGGPGVPAAPARSLPAALCRLAVAVFDPADDSAVRVQVTACPPGEGQALAAPTEFAGRDPASRGNPGTLTLVLGVPGAAAHESAWPGDRTWLVTADNWTMCVATLSGLSQAGERLPHLDAPGTVTLAAWLAACVAVGEVFKHIGDLDPQRGSRPDVISANLWTLSGGPGAAHCAGPQGPRDAPVIPPHYLVGAGAVAEAYLAALATSATRAQIAVLDDDFISDKNLNRHLLAGPADLEHPKAALAARRLDGSTVKVWPLPQRWQDFVATQHAERGARPDELAADDDQLRLRLAVSAVDRNDARMSIAALCPDMVIGGSTNGLSAEVSRYEAGGPWQCLACANPPETTMSLEEAADELRRMSQAELDTVILDHGLDGDAVRAYLRSPECGSLGERDVGRFRSVGPRPDWSVAFVSAASGVLTAARMIKEIAGDDAERAAMAAAGDTIRLSFLSSRLFRTAHRRRPGCPYCS